MTFNRRTLLFSAAIVTLLTASFFTVSASDAARSAVAQLWQLAPAAPQIAESDRLAELRQRRAEVMKRMGDKAVLVLFGAEPRVYTNDVDYHYRQENNLYYLTGIKQEDATLILLPGAAKTREILFLPPRDPRNETWHGRMLSADEARARSGVQEVWDNKLLNGLLAYLMPRAEQALAKRGNVSKPNDQLAAQWQSEFQPVLDAIKSDKAELYLLTPRGNDLREYRAEHEFASAISAANAGLTIKNAQPIFAELRQIKSPWEIKLMQHAVDISAEAFFRVYAMAAPGLHEYEVQAEFEYTYRRRNADNWGYPCIVGAGDNATTLHYITSQDSLDDNRLLLMDCAAEYDHYSADITRTIPINGKFSPAQADIYRIIYDAQEAAFKASRAGANLGQVQQRAADVVKDGLLRLGLITSKDNQEFRTWFMHGTSHWLGMNVHDVGMQGKALAAGMIYTVEPGIYVRPDALEWLPKTPENEKFIKAVRPAFEKYKGVGVRIEDDVLITNGDPVIMSAAIPRKLEDVEATMTRLRRELKTSGWPLAAAR